MSTKLFDVVNFYSPKSLWIQIKEFVLSFVFFSRNPHLVYPHAEHLHDPYRRTFTSVDLAHDTLTKLLLNDEHYFDALGKFEGEVLSRACLVGDELRVNMYRLERYEDGPIVKPFNPYWVSDGIADLWVTKVSLIVDGKAQTNFRCEPLKSKRNTDLSYNPYEPYASYVRMLTDAERQELARFTQYQYDNTQSLA